MLGSVGIRSVVLSSSRPKRGPRSRKPSGGRPRTRDRRAPSRRGDLRGDVFPIVAIGRGRLRTSHRRRLAARAHGRRRAHRRSAARQRRHGGRRAPARRSRLLRAPTGCRRARALRRIGGGRTFESRRQRRRSERSLTVRLHDLFDERLRVRVEHVEAQRHARLVVFAHGDDDAFTAQRARAVGDQKLEADLRTRRLRRLRAEEETRRRNVLRVLVRELVEIFVPERNPERDDVSVGGHGDSGAGVGV
jgi:hypothetical protein